MNPRNPMLRSLLLPLLLCAGCSASPDSTDEDVGQADQAMIAGNGLYLNGLYLNGLYLNGFQLTGFQLNGFQLNGLYLNGAELTGIISEDGAPVSGANFVGTTMTALLSDGSSRELLVTDVQPTSDPEIYAYSINYHQGSALVGLCGADNRAIPLTGYWDASSGAHIDDPSRMTFACMGSTLQKCVDFGYKPWASATECDAGGDCHEVSLRSFHQACTRMIRADYCGDGVPHTVNGTPINMWDDLGIQEAADAAMVNEAEWGVDGAGCVSALRHQFDGATADYIDAHCPERWGTASTCFNASSTFFTEHGYSSPLTQRRLLRNQSNATLP